MASARRVSSHLSLLFPAWAGWYSGGVTLNPTHRRRWFGGLCLLVAIALVVVESTVLKDRLGSVTLLVYWLVCFVFTAMAIGAAFADLRQLRRETREAQRALFEKTLEQIRQEQAAKRAAGAAGPPQPSNKKMNR